MAKKTRDTQQNREIIVEREMWSKGSRSGVTVDKSKNAITRRMTQKASRKASHPTIYVGPVSGARVFGNDKRLSADNS